jgi:hypothetical protein
LLLMFMKTMLMIACIMKTIKKKIAGANNKIGTL